MEEWQATWHYFNVRMLVPHILYQICSSLFISMPLDILGLYSLKTQHYGYRNPHYKPKIVWPPYQVYHGNPYSNKKVSSLWIKALILDCTKHLAGIILANKDMIFPYRLQRQYSIKVCLTMKDSKYNFTNQMISSQNNLVWLSTLFNWNGQQDFVRHHSTSRVNITCKKTKLQYNSTGWHTLSKSMPAKPVASNSYSHFTDSIFCIIVRWDLIF